MVRDIDGGNAVIEEAGEFLIWKFKYSVHLVQLIECVVFKNRRIRISIGKRKKIGLILTGMKFLKGGHYVRIGEGTLRKSS